MYEIGKPDIFKPFLNLSIMQWGKRYRLYTPLLASRYEWQGIMVYKPGRKQKSGRTTPVSLYKKKNSPVLLK
jgi:hypothetical protein